SEFTPWARSPCVGRHRRRHSRRLRVVQGDDRDAAGIKYQGTLPGWLDGFPEVGRRRGPWRRRWAKDLLDAFTEDENNSLRNGAACQRLCKSRNRAATQPSL